MHIFLKKQSRIIIIPILIVCFLFSSAPRAHAIELANCASAAISGLIGDAVAKWALGETAGAATQLPEDAALVAGGTESGAQIFTSVPISNPAADTLIGGLLLGDIKSHAFQDAGKPILDTIAYTFGQCALNALTEDTVNWIKGGFNGSPNFAVNPSQLFQDIANNVTDDFSNEILQGIETCNFSPNFNSDLANSVLLSTRSGASGKFRASVKCNFPSNINPSEFYDDFSKGGWGGFEASLSDRGNTFGVKLATSRELATRQEAAQAKQDQKLAHSNGFLDIVDESDCPDMPDRVTYGIIQGDITGKEKKAYQQEYCNTITPGKMLSETLSKSIGTDMERLGFADNMNKIISALIQLVTTKVKDGIFK